jgi:hypothetical protein
MAPLAYQAYSADFTKQKKPGIGETDAWFKVTTEEHM